MSFVYSLILYNPLETLMSILFCDALTKRKFNVNDWKAVYVLSTVNLLIQYLNIYISNTLFKLTYNIFVNLVVMTITLFVIYFVFFYKEIDHKTNNLVLMYRNAFLSQAFNFTSICVVIAAYNYIFEHVYTYACSTIPRIHSKYDG